MPVDLSKYKLAKPITTQPVAAPTSAVNLDKYKLATTPAPGKYATAFAGVSKPKSGTLTLDQQKGNFEKTKESIVGASQAGFDKLRSGYKEARDAKNPLELLEGGVKQASGLASIVFSPLAPIFEPVSKAINYVGDKIGNNKAVQKFAMSKAGETTSRVTENVADLANVAGAVAGVRAPAKFGRAKTEVPTIKTEPVTPPKTDVPPPKTPIKEPPTTVNIRDPKFNGLRTEISKGNVNPQVRTSIERMAGKGDDILKKYEEFYDQETRYKADPKEDTAISKVGENIGNAFERVVELRREAGRVMGDEIKRIGSQKVDLTDNFTNFETKLRDEANAVFDPKEGIKSTTRQSALTKEDTGLLNTYVKELNELGAQPSIGDVDAFVRRITSELELYKSKNNFTTTNAERLVKSNLAELRDSFNPTKNPELETYYKARQQYSNLSDFLEEGQSFLGKKTQSGDFAKDASVAKSSVQSVLNNGKKDWLIRLEDLTGYPAIDDASIALQAMKDAGNVQGRSLLELFSPENKAPIPFSKEGMINKVLDTAVSGAKRAFVGTPKAQTIRVIKSLDPKINSFNKTKVNRLMDGLIEKNKEAKTYIDDFVKKLAAENKANVIEAPLKTTESILRKAKDEYGGRVSSLNMVNDVARNSIISDAATHTGIIDKIKKEFGAKKGFKLKKPNPAESYGYAGYNIKVPTPNGTVAEIQVISPEMIVAKMKPEKSVQALGKEMFDKIVEKSGVKPGLGHELYEQIRSADKAKNKGLIDKLIEESKEYYSHFAG